MKKKQFKSKLLSKVNALTSLFFCYTIFSLSFPSPISLKRQDVLDKEIIYIKKGNFNINDQKVLIKKVYSDLDYRKILKFHQNKCATHISITREGKIIGYKPTKLRLVSYSLEKQIIDLLRKNTLLTHPERSIYWLDITNKY